MAGDRFIPMQSTIKSILNAVVVIAFRTWCSWIFDCRAWTASRSASASGEFSTVPIIMLTARTEQRDKVYGLEMGADDYLTETVHRPGTARPRQGRPAPQPRLCRGEHAAAVHVPRVQHGPGPPQGPCPWQGHPLLTPTEYRLLAQLVSNADRIGPDDQLMETVWGPEYKDETEYLKVYIRRLRLKIEGDPRWISVYITSQPGVGYQWNTVASSEEAAPV